MRTPCKVVYWDIILFIVLVPLILMMVPIGSGHPSGDKVRRTECRSLSHDFKSGLTSGHVTSPSLDASVTSAQSIDRFVDASTEVDVLPSSAHRGPEIDRAPRHTLSAATSHDLPSFSSGRSFPSQFVTWAGDPPKALLSVKWRLIAPRLT